MGAFVSDIKIVDGGSDAEARGKCPAGYTLVPVDLNKGAKGSWIYLCFAKNNDADPVVSMALSFSSNTTPRNMGFGSLIDVDLNKGAKGKYIYLWYITRSRRDSLRNQNAVIFNAPWNQWYLFGNSVIDMTVQAGSSRPTAPTGYIRVEGYDVSNKTGVDPDVNLGAGGNYIYIYYKRSPALVTNNNG